MMPGGLNSRTTIFGRCVFAEARTLCLKKQSSRGLSSLRIGVTQQRRAMWQWLNTTGVNFVKPVIGTPQYLGAYDMRGRLRGDSGGSKADRPFPANTHFKSQSVLSEPLKEAIWERIMKNGQSVEMVSAELGVEMSRVGAVVRLKEIEKEWIRQGKRLAKPYADAVMAMLPQTPYRRIGEPGQRPHESINDLPVHAATRQQLFYPTSESRRFARADAARAFDDALLPADERVPHPELAQMERDRVAGLSREARAGLDRERRAGRLERKAAADARRRRWEERSLTRVEGRRFEFRFREVNVDDAGPDGRGHRATGWRYGLPHADRKRHEIKIPTRVE